MISRPILFSPPMVRALLDGRKTETRRLMDTPLARAREGDWLWVQEAFAIRRLGGREFELTYRADDQRKRRIWPARLAEPRPAPRPGRFMPRELSRISLRVAESRIERLWEIDEAGAAAEGMMPDGDGRWRDIGRLDAADAPRLDTARHAFGEYWQRLHPRPAESWDANPEVLVLRFDRIAARNIDEIAAGAAT